MMTEELISQQTHAFDTENMKQEKLHRQLYDTLTKEKIMGIILSADLNQ